MLPSLVIGDFVESRVRSLSEGRRDALVISTRMLWVGFRGHVCRVRSAERRMIVALFAEPGRVVPNAEMIELCYGDDEDGGPELATQSQAQNRIAVLFVCAMVGAKLERANGGYFVRDAGGTP
jgi:hypothetical protein